MKTFVEEFILVLYCFFLTTCEDVLLVEKIFRQTCESQVHIFMKIGIFVNTFNLFNFSNAWKTANCKLYFLGNFCCFIIQVSKLQNDPRFQQTRSLFTCGYAFIISSVDLNNKLMCCYYIGLCYFIIYLWEELFIGFSHRLEKYC